MKGEACQEAIGENPSRPAAGTRREKIWQNGGSAGAHAQTVAHFSRHVQEELPRPAGGLRPGCGAKDALRRVDAFLQSGPARDRAAKPATLSSERKYLVSVEPAADARVVATAQSNGSQQFLNKRGIIAVVFRLLG